MALNSQVADQQTFYFWTLVGSMLATLYISRGSTIQVSMLQLGCGAGDVAGLTTPVVHFYDSHLLTVSTPMSIAVIQRTGSIIRS
eukprot:COSAG02_NODE_6993_length_3237_cov_2.545889_1_plen_85_part_00